MTQTAAVVILLYFDNTLLDNDRIINDLKLVVYQDVATSRVVILDIA